MAFASSTSLTLRISRLSPLSLSSSSSSSFAQCSPPASCTPTLLCARTPPYALMNWLKRLTGGAKLSPPPPGGRHAVNGTPLRPPHGGAFEPPLREALFALGCFWGPERTFWKTPGVYTTSVGYSGGQAADPTYRAVCSGRTGHAEVVNVVYDETKLSYEQLLDVYWASHDPTVKNRQGPDVGDQYRSAIFYFDDEQKKAAEQTRDHFDAILKQAGRHPTTTEIKPASKYYLAEDYHQQYMHKNPFSLCTAAGTGLYYPRSNAAQGK